MIEEITQYPRIMLSMIELECRRLMHDQTETLIRVVQPILWLLIFGHVISSLNSIPTGGVPYTDYILPGVLIQSTTTIAIMFGLVIIWERESGILKKLIASPAPKTAVVVGRSMAAGVRAISSVVILLPIAVLFGVNLILNPLYLLLAFILIFLSAGGFAALSILVASMFKTRERFVGIGSLITLPLFFGSNALYPLSAMPSWLQAFANVNPMTYIISALRSLLITGNLSVLPIDIAVIVVFDLVLFALASWNFNKIIE